MFFRTRRSTLLATFIAVFFAACGPRNADSGHDSVAVVAQSRTIEVVDDAGLTIKLDSPAKRIISLIPSATETLISIGATGQIVGRTRYDVDSAVMHLPSVGGGIDASIEVITSLKPDLVVGWESDKRQLLRGKLQQFHIPMFLLRTQDTTDVFRGLARLGKLTGHDSNATAVAAHLRADLDSVHQSVKGLKSPRVFYVVFNDPPMTAGPDSFIGQLVSLAGGTSIFADAQKNYPNVTIEEIVKRDPDMLVVPVGEFKGNSVERFRAMQGYRTLRAVRTGNVFTVPADLLSRPSPGIGKAAHVLRDIFHPQLAPKRDAAQSR